MEIRILIVESSADCAKDLRGLLADGYSVTRVSTELAALRELSARWFDLLIVGIHQNRAKEGLRLIETLLVDRKVASVPPVTVLSDVGDPDFIQRCARLGIADYVLYSAAEGEMRLRVERVIARFGGLGEKLVRVSTSYLGPAARIFLERQAKAHLGLGALDDLDVEHLPALLAHVAAESRPILKDKARPFLRRLEQAFGFRPQY